MARARSAVSASSASRSGRREVELGDPRLLASQPLAELGRVRSERVGLGAGVAAIGVDALEAVGGGGELAVVLVELP